jgi:exodeoxyribonuclease V alpha subunit
LARDIRGIGFKTADAIAMKLGVDKTAMVRVRAGISYALTEASMPDRQSSGESRVSTKA